MQIRAASKMTHEQCILLRVVWPFLKAHLTFDNKKKNLCKINGKWEPSDFFLFRHNRSTALPLLRETKVFHYSACCFKMSETENSTNTVSEKTGKARRPPSIYCLPGLSPEAAADRGCLLYHDLEQCWIKVNPDHDYNFNGNSSEKKEGEACREWYTTQ